MKVYKIKDDLTQEQLEDAGFLTQEIEGEIQYVCFVPQELDSDLPQSLVNIYQNPQWRRKFYFGENKKELKNTLGIEFDNKKGKLKMSDKLKQTLCLWNVQFMDNDRMLTLTSFDPFDSKAFCNPKVLEQYCGKLIKELKEKDFIEEVEVDIK